MLCFDSWTIKLVLNFVNVDNLRAHGRRPAYGNLITFQSFRYSEPKLWNGYLLILKTQDSASEADDEIEAILWISVILRWNSSDEEKRFLGSPIHKCYGWKS